MEEWVEECLFCHHFTNINHSQAYLQADKIALKLLQFFTASHNSKKYKNIIKKHIRNINDQIVKKMTTKTSTSWTAEKYLKNICTFFAFQKIQTNDFDTYLSWKIVFNNSKIIQ